MTPLRTVMFGYGFAGAWIHDPLIRAVPGLAISAVVTSSPQRAGLARSRDPDVLVFSTVEEALDVVDADLAVVATPNRYHVELAVASMKAGMTVVVDKPLANNADDARLVTDEAQRLGQALAVFHNRRWDGDFLTVKQLLRTGRLGTVHRLTSRFDRWVPDRASNWRDDDPESGGGLLLDLGSHLVDQAIVLLGPITSVYCELRTLNPGRQSDDDVFISLQHRAGAASHLYASSLEGEPATRFHVSGSEGAYVKEGKDIQEERLLAGEPVVPGRSGREPPQSWGKIARGAAVETVETAIGDWSAFYRQLVAHLTEGAPIPVTGDDACEVLRVLDAARLSARNGTVVDVNGAAIP